MPFIHIPMQNKKKGHDIIRQPTHPFPSTITLPSPSTHTHVVSQRQITSHDHERQHRHGKRQPGLGHVRRVLAVPGPGRDDLDDAVGRDLAGGDGGARHHDVDDRARGDGRVRLRAGRGVEGQRAGRRAVPVPVARRRRDGDDGGAPGTRRRRRRRHGGLARGRAVGRVDELRRRGPGRRARDRRGDGHGHGAVDEVRGPRRPGLDLLGVVRRGGVVVGGCLRVFGCRRGVPEAVVAVGVG